MACWCDTRVTRHSTTSPTSGSAAAARLRRCTDIVGRFSAAELDSMPGLTILLGRFVGPAGFAGCVMETAPSSDEYRFASWM